MKSGKLVPEAGEEMHAASFLRKRSMVLDGLLRRDIREWRRIFVHELFHFCWIRLSNASRNSWRALLAGESTRRARGELGWSSESRKKSLAKRDVSDETPAWRDYACESFCDTAAWLYAGIPAHEEFSLALKWRKPRRLWFIQQFGDRGVPL